MARRARTSSGASGEAAAKSGGRPRSGDVVEWERKNGDRGYGVRFYDAEGVRRYERCGLESEGWSRRRAEIELENFSRLVQARAHTSRLPMPAQPRSRTRCSARSRGRSWPSTRSRSSRDARVLREPARAAPRAVLREAAPDADLLVDGRRLQEAAPDAHAANPGRSGQRAIRSGTRNYSHCGSASERSTTRSSCWP